VTNNSIKSATNNSAKSVPFNSETYTMFDITEEEVLSFAASQKVTT